MAAHAALPLGLKAPNGKLLPDKPLQGPVDAVLSTVKGINETIAALQTAITAIQKGVNGDGTPANPGLAAEVQAYLQELAADPTAAPDSAPGFVTGALVPPALTVLLPQVISIVSKVASPICPAVGAVASLQNVALPTIPDYSIFGPLAPVVKNADQTAQAQITDIYTSLIAQALAPKTLPAAAAALQPYVTIAELVISLLNVTWESTYFPEGGGAPIVHKSPGVMFLPTLIDVDNNLTFDLCVNMGLDLLGGTGKVTQQISRIPTSDPNMKVDVNGSITIALGTTSINLGYGIDTRNSHVPAMYETSTNTSMNPATTQLNVPGDTFAQYQNTNLVLLGSPLAVQGRIETIKPPHTYTYGSTATKSGTTTIGTTYKWVSSPAVTQSAQKTHTTGTLLGTAIDSWSGIGATATNAWEYCSSTNSGFCSNAPSAEKAVETISSHAKSTGNPEIFNVTAANPTVCPAGLHLKGNFSYGAKIPTTASPAGHAWIDSDNGEVTGCQQAGSALSSTVTQGLTLPVGFKANDRLATWTGTGPALSKTGTITCPATTTIKSGPGNAIVTTSGYLCVAPPVNTVKPSITGDAYVGNVLTANPGTWTPGAPNAPSFTYQWQSCDADGTACGPITGATASTYKPSLSDEHRSVRVVVTGTNADGSVAAPVSNATAEIVIPPAPVNTALPTITGLRGAGRTLTGAPGTWQYFPTFEYSWELCDLDGTNCAPISGANSTTYTPTESDEAHVIRLHVLGTNPGGTTAAYSLDTIIPGTPVNTVLPKIISNGNDVTGVGVLQDDVLSTDNGTWTYGDTFTHQWLRCDASTCSPIAGATNPTYKLVKADVGNTVAVRVTAHNNNVGPTGLANVDSLPTGDVDASSLSAKAPKEIVDGPVLAAAKDGNNSFVGGTFDAAGLLNGHGGQMSQNSVNNTATGTPLSLDAKANGDILASVADGQNGYFIGGNFTKVNGTPCPGFAHLKSDGTVEPKYCIPGLQGIGGNRAEVRAISFNVASATHMLALGGSFKIADASAVDHTNLVFFDYNLASLVPVFPSDGDPNGPVNAITNNSSATFIIGGEFTKVGAADRGALVQEVITGGVPARPANWPAGVCQTALVAGPCTGPGVVKTLGYSALGAVFVGGSFTGFYRGDTNPGGALSTTFRSNALFATTTTTAGSTFGIAQGWAPNPNGPVNAIQGGVITAAAGPYTIYLGGEFTRVGGTYTAGQPVSAAPTGASVLAVTNLAEWGLTLSSGNSSVGAINTSSPDANFTPYVNGPVNTLFLGTGTCATATGQSNTCNTAGNPTTQGAPLFIGGSFTKAGNSAGTAVTRMRLAKLVARTQSDAATAALDTDFAPVAGNTVYALAGNSTIPASPPAAPVAPAATVFAGGKFRVLGGVIRNNVAKFDNDGNLQSWTGDGGTNGTVRALSVIGSNVYAGGDFTSAGGSARGRLAAFDTASGALGTWAPEADGSVRVLTAKASSLLVGGGFANVGGAARAHLAEVDLAGVATSLVADTDGPVNAINLAGATTYVGGSFANIGGQARSNVAAINSDTGAVDGSFSPAVNGAVNALQANASGVFIGGSFTDVAGSARSNLALVDLTGAVVGGWNPSPNGVVNALSYDSVTDTIIVGGQFSTIGGKARKSLASLNADATTNGGATGFHPDPTGTVYAIIGYAPGAGIFGDFSTIGVYDTVSVSFFG